MRDEIAKILAIPTEGPHLSEALTHPSYRNEVGGIKDNQRLEFLGDAVLGFCTSELLWARFPEAAEGELTRMRAQLVNADVLAQWARDRGLAEAILLGKGALKNGLGSSTNVLADAVEALIAAAYLDGGMDAARTACLEVIRSELERVERLPARDPKSELQERVQALGGDAPIYEVAESGGPAHDPWFRVTVRISGGLAAEGRGRSKRAAERAAATEALSSGAWEAHARKRPRSEAPGSELTGSTYPAPANASSPPPRSES